MLAPHSHDPEAVVIRPLREDSAEDGAWAGKLGSHAAHHRFGTFGRLPHLQLNVWRVGVKGSGTAYRLPRPSLRALMNVVMQLLA